MKTKKPTAKKGHNLPETLRPKDLQKILKTTIRAATESGAVLRSYFGKKLTIAEKQGEGLVSNADLKSEQTCIRILKKDFSDFRFLAEESGTSQTKRTAEQSPGRWILDPLDGTTNFIHRFPMFCVSIAAEWQGEVVVGVVYHPILKTLWHAVKGQGAYANGQRISVSKTERLEQSVLTTGFAQHKQQYLKPEIEIFESLSRRTRAIRRPGSAALDLAYTSQGIFDGFWEINLSPWDVAAGALLVQEAGGKVTHYRGESFAVEGRQILATNPALHPKMLEILAPLAPPVAPYTQIK